MQIIIVVPMDNFASLYDAIKKWTPLLESTLEEYMKVPSAPNGARFLAWISATNRIHGAERVPFDVAHAWVLSKLSHGNIVDYCRVATLEMVEQMVRVVARTILRKVVEDVGYPRVMRAKCSSLFAHDVPNIGTFPNPGMVGLRMVELMPFGIREHEMMVISVHLRKNA